MTDRRPLFTRTSDSWHDVAIDVLCLGALIALALAEKAVERWRA